MPLATSAEREFEVRRAGSIRDLILANFREGLRGKSNPETGAPLTEEELARVVAPGSRFHIQAQGDDDYAQLEQRGALYLADQVKLERATGQWLIDYHAKLWGEDFLPASGSSGPVQVSGTPGTVITGSTNIGDDGALKARDAAGKLYQVFETAVVSAVTGYAIVTFASIDTGDVTNIPEGTVLTWSQTTPGLQPNCTVYEDFRGGTDRETEPELASRIGSIIRYRPGAGNSAQYRAWARKSSNAVEDGFIYPCAQHNGSVVVAITQKRKKALGPLARIPSSSTMNAAIGYLTPTTSPVVPEGVFVVTVPCVSEPSDLIIKLSMQRASRTGWVDPQPFPSGNSAIVGLSNQKLFAISAPDAYLPGLTGAGTLYAPNAPRMMVWNQAQSAWEELKILSVSGGGAGVFAVTLSDAPSFTIAVGMKVSPMNGRHAVIAGAVEDYFDERGPGNFFDVLNDSRGARCVRFPEIQDEWPTDAGAEVVTDILNALGGGAGNGVLASITKTTPSYTAAFATGPKMLTLGQLQIYPL